MKNIGRKKIKGTVYVNPKYKSHELNQRVFYNTVGTIAAGYGGNVAADHLHREMANREKNIQTAAYNRALKSHPGMRGKKHGGVQYTWASQPYVKWGDKPHQRAWVSHDIGKSGAKFATSKDYYYRRTKKGKKVRVKKGRKAKRR